MMTFAFPSKLHVLVFSFVNTPGSHEGEAKNGGIVHKRAVGVKSPLQPKNTILKTNSVNTFLGFA
jgi:hypothetical protein